MIRDRSRRASEGDLYKKTSEYMIRDPVSSLERGPETSQSPGAKYQCFGRGTER